MYPVRPVGQLDIGTNTDTGPSLFSTEPATDTAAQSPLDTAPTPGILGYYFDRYNFRAYATCTRDDVIDFEWITQAPAPLLAADSISVRWEGYITPDFSEPYTFTVASDDGARLWVADTLVVDNWKLQSVTDASGQIDLVAGTPVKLVLEYFNLVDGGEVHLQWQSPSLPVEIVPATAFTAGECGEPIEGAPPVIPSVAACLAGDDFDDGMVGEAWHFDAIGPTGAVDVTEGTAITLFAEDGYRFAEQIGAGAFLFQAIRGDVDVSFQVNSIDSNNGIRATHPPEMGLMMSDSLEVDGRSVFMGLTPVKTAVMAVRQEAGGSVNESFSHVVPLLPYWVRLSRSGDTFNGYVSLDGAAWELVGSAQLSLNDTFLVGIVQSSGTPNRDATGTGDNFEVTVGGCN